MSLHATIDQLAAVSGAIALAIDHPETERTLRVELTWPALFEGTMTFLDVNDETTIRLAIGEQTLIIQKVLDVVVAVVVPTVEEDVQPIPRSVAREERAQPRPAPARAQGKRRGPPPPPRAPQKGARAATPAVS